MKAHLLIPGFAISLTLLSCESRQDDSTTLENSPKDVPAETVEIEEATVEAEVPEETPVEIEEQRDEVSGALIGGAAGGVIGHQSGRVLEGAAIGGALGGAALGGALVDPESLPDEEEE